MKASAENLEKMIAALENLSRSDLAEQWQAQYRSKPPKGISRQLMIRIIAYEIQARHYGALKPAMRRQLQKAISGDASHHRGSSASPVSLRPGARLLREWNGVTHTIEVIEGGFIWNDEKHRSLSAIARAITGARWSGPRFFGLNGDGSP